MLKKITRVLFYILLLVLTWAIDVYHMGVFPRPKITKEMTSQPSYGQWISKEKYGMNHLVVQGSPVQRGELTGQYTKDLLRKQEQELIGKFQKIVPRDLYRHILEVLTIRWFVGIEKYFEPWMVEEMYGVSFFAPKEFEFLGDGLTRQVMYHGLHEVGQMFVDQKGNDMGCTVVAAPLPEGGWILGRNFDFEGGRIFDTEKIVKWVFPDRGYDYVSIIWAGMVGVVTGINEKGVYISINAAGSDDFARHGTPSTLVITKALLGAATADEAIEIIKKEQMFITDIFVVSDGHKFYKIEKSPKRTAIIRYEGTAVITNHLTDPIWANDTINAFREFKLTSHARFVRGEKLLKTWDGTRPEQNILNILRDKGDDMPLHLGNRNAIDALIASHSIIYNQNTGILYVSHGPSVAGGFTGFDLKKSFAAKAPMPVGALERDPLVSDEMYAHVKNSDRLVSSAEKEIKKGKCKEGFQILKQATFTESADYYMAMGNYHECIRESVEAREMWSRALTLRPAYAFQIEYLQGKLK